MPLKLKVDLHTHTAEDVKEIIAGMKNEMIPAKAFIDLAVKQNFDAISITHHGVLFNEPSVFKYAQEKGLLLIPGVETFINKKHVLLINYTNKKYILNYQDLQKYKNDHMLVIAPHPYYLDEICLGKDLEKNIDCFDAIEYCHYYYKFFNLNKKALRIARKYNLPVIGNSDTHYIEQFGTTYSYVYAEEKTIPAIISAIKAGKVEYVSHPQSLKDFLLETKRIFRRLPSELRIRYGKQSKKSLLNLIQKITTILNSI